MPDTIMSTVKCYYYVMCRVANMFAVWHNAGDASYYYVMCRVANVFAVWHNAGIIMLLAVPYFDQSNKWCLNLPNVANVSFHFPTLLRIYMLAFIPGN